MSIFLHPLLRQSQHEVVPDHRCYILWDLREAPAFSARSVSRLEHSIPHSHLSQNATVPPTTLLYITIGILPESWAITVQNAWSITVLDVLASIYSSLLTPLTHSEWDRLSLKHRQRVTGMFENRCRLSANEQETRSQGVLRVDCLLRHTWFAGLTISLEVENSCILSLRRPR
ncbi:ectomycorrhiza-regulated small secreted protein [Crucibulum laeve]|uniref:Ectomycorrhiza-regulated small secreted protein n=1 Tax=Crucibulum laeve TaxID=68775 RepID=A0A5C3LGV4_9AGAR|nr:ectomycorrhiza-regulated small secreted protein [Crucibulum laeve]